jgi:hypothetical protein
LSWQTENATSIELDQADKGVVSGATATNGDITLNADQGGLFVLVALNERGVRDSAAVWVQVDAPTSEIVFTASPSRVRSGDPATLAWHATGARAVSLAEKGGKTLDLGGQVETGTVNVNPAVKTTWVLTVDGQTREATIDVTPVIDVFKVAPDSATPGQPLTLTWQTRGSNGVTLSLGGVGDIYSESDPNKVSAGSFDYTVSPDLAATDVLTFQLVAQGGSSNTTQTVQVYKMGSPHVTSWTVPPYALAGSSFSVAWTTTGSDTVEILRDGLSVYRSATPDDAIQGSVTFPAPTADQSFQLRAIDSHGGVALSDALTVSPVGMPDPGNSTFTASTSSIASGGTPVTLTWTAPNARNLKIVGSGVKAVGTIVLTASSSAPTNTIQPGQLSLQGYTSSPYATTTPTLLFTNLTGGTLSPGGTLAVTVVATAAGTDYNTVAPNSISWGKTSLASVTPSNPPVANGTWLTTQGEDASTVYAVQGVGAASGSIQVFPNRNTDYCLTGDNGAGDTLTPMTVSVAVAQPARLNFSMANVPIGGIVQLSGPTVPGAGALEPLNFAAQNLSTQQFVDIAGTGTEIVFPNLSATANALVSLPQNFQATWRGVPVGGQSLNVNFGGWMAFGNIPVAPNWDNGPPTKRGVVSVLGTLATRVANSHVYWQMDGAGSQQRLIVQWTNLGVSTTGTVGLAAYGTFTVEAQLYSTGEVVLAYPQVPTYRAGQPNIFRIGAVAGDDASGWVMPSTGQRRYVLGPMKGDRFGLFTKLPASYDYITAQENLRVSVDMGNGARMVVQDAETVVAPNQVTLTEAMMNPPAGTANGEWLELTNNTATAFDLNGWDLQFGNNSKYSFTTSVMVPANGILVLGQNSTAPAASAVNYFSYGAQYTLPKNGSPVVLSRANGVYSSLGLAPAGLVGTVVPGYSVQLGGKATGWSYVSGLNATVCTAPTASSYGTGLYGTPGAANPTCPAYVTKASINPGTFEPLAADPAASPLLPGNQDNDIVTLPLAAPARFGGLSYSTVYVGTNGFLSLEPLTCAADTTYGTCFASPASSVNQFAALPQVGLVAPFWTDLMLGTGGIYTARRTPATGPAYTIVSWEKVTFSPVPVSGTPAVPVFYPTSIETYQLNFQVKLFDNGNIEFHYGNMSGNGTTAAANNAKGYHSTTWLQTPLGEASNTVNTSFSTSIAAGTGWRFTAQ